MTLTDLLDMQAREFCQSIAFPASNHPDVSKRSICQLYEPLYVAGDMYTCSAARVRSTAASLVAGRNLSVNRETIQSAIALLAPTEAEPRVIFSSPVAVATAGLVPHS